MRWDIEGRLVKVESKNDGGTFETFQQHTYDSDDDRLSTEDATGRTLTFAYDTLKRLASVTDDAPTPNLTTFGDDAAGNRTKVVDALSRETE